MIAHHPLQKQLERQGEHRSEARIRQQLQLRARELLRDANNPNSDADTVALAALRGRLMEYLAIRNLLAPTIATDGYMRELQGALHRLDVQLRDVRAV